MVLAIKKYEKQKGSKYQVQDDYITVETEEIFLTSCFEVCFKKITNWNEKIP